MTVDWSKPIEAVEKATGRVVPVTFLEQVGNTWHTHECPDPNTTNRYWKFDGADQCANKAWFVRNRVAIDWTKPLELEDGTAVRIEADWFDGDRTLSRSDGKLFTEKQVGPRPQNSSQAIWCADGSRYDNGPGLRVRNRVVSRPTAVPNSVGIAYRDPAPRDANGPEVRLAAAVRALLATTTANDHAASFVRESAQRLLVELGHQ